MIHKNTTYLQPPKDDNNNNNNNSNTDEQTMFCQLLTSVFQ